jgi:hypothetical protein
MPPETIEVGIIWFKREDVGVGVSVVLIVVLVAAGGTIVGFMNIMHDNETIISMPAMISADLDFIALPLSKLFCIYDRLPGSVLQQNDTSFLAGEL